MILDTASQATNTPEELRSHAGPYLRRVTLSCGLSEVPLDILSCAPNVEFLDLSRNNLNLLPDWFDQLSSLKVLFLSYNRFTEVPAVLGRCRSLRMLGMRDNHIEHIPSDALPSSLQWLTLTNNHITSLPESIGSVAGLQKLLLAGNRLSALPTSLRRTGSLELIRLSANAFESFPEWLFHIPSLAWVALAGNPCTALNDVTEREQQRISWSDLSIQEELGRGASGSTYRALHKPKSGDVREVAVKVFTSNISSDGASQDERFAALRAGEHPHLSSTIASLEGHPDGLSGLILELIPSTFRNLAGPPSFESCTRDVYVPELTISPQQLALYAYGIASAAHHLHSLNIVHGDLYAHNILVDSHRALVSDFGAACLYTRHSKLPAALIERVEVHAFGILMHELLSHVHATDANTYERLVTPCTELAARCIAKHVSARPSFEEAKHILGALI